MNKDKTSLYDVVEKLPAIGTSGPRVSVRCPCGTISIRKVRALADDGSSRCRSCTLRLLFAKKLKLPKQDPRSKITIIGESERRKGMRYLLARCACGAELVVSYASAMTVLGCKNCYIERARERNGSVEDRFWRFVDKESSDNGCWLWIGATNDHGYGKFGVTPKKIVFATRFMIELTKQIELSEEDFVLHECDTPLCVRPDHLRVGSRLENSLDAVKKGRMCSGDNHPFFGTKPQPHKLTDENVVEIRRRYDAGETNADLAKAFGAAVGTTVGVIQGISHPGKRRSFRHMTPEERERATEMIAMRIPYSDIARAIGVTSHSISNLAQRTSMRARQLTVEERERVVEWHRSGRSPADLARELGVPKTIVTGVIVRAKDKAGRAVRTSRVTTPEEREQIALMIANGVPYSEIASKFGLSVVAIYSQVAKANDPARLARAARRIRIIQQLADGVPHDVIAANEGITTEAVYYWRKKIEKERTT